MEKPNFHFLLKSDDPAALMPPATFIASWTRDTEYLKGENVTVWQARCSSPSYHAIGDLLTVSIFYTCKAIVNSIFKA